MREKLCNKFPSERETICNKILNILNINSETNYFYLYDLDNSREQQYELLSLKDDIKKYFACSSTSTFKPNFECKRPYLNLIKSILKKQGYTIEASDYNLRFENGLYRRTIKYQIFRNKSPISPPQNIEETPESLGEF